MTITATCQACQQQYRLGDAWAGKTATCKKCGHTMHIPSPGQPQGEMDLTPAPAPAGAASPSAGAVRRGGKCPICDSPMSASDATCGVCGYSASTSKHLAVTQAVSAPKAAGGGTKVKSEEKAEKGAGSSQLTVRLLIIGGIAAAVLLVAGAIGMIVSKGLQERARLASRERLNVMMTELREAREASFVQSTRILPRSISRRSWENTRSNLRRNCPKCRSSSRSWRARTRSSRKTSGVGSSRSSTPCRPVPT